MSYTVHYFPVGQPYTPPRDLTEDEIAQVISYLASKGIEIQASDMIQDRSE